MTPSNLGLDWASENYGSIKLVAKCFAVVHVNLPLSA
jgi:hypothetical protein